MVEYLPGFGKVLDSIPSAGTGVGAVKGKFNSLTVASIEVGVELLGLQNRRRQMEDTLGRRNMHFRGPEPREGFVGLEP